MTETNPTFINVAGHSDAMTVIAKSDYCEGVLDLWRDVLGGVASAIQRMGAHPARAVVLVPYAQLMPWAQHYWGLLHPDGFAPRFETTRNWARQLDAFLPQGNDLAGDTGRDILTARALLDRAGGELGFDVARMMSFEVHGLRVSSSAVRQALAEGDMDRAAALLGRPYAISGRAVHGRKLGRELGFRTLNLRFVHPRPAAMGIFVARIHGLGPGALPGVASLGVRPTVEDAGRVLLETHALEWPQTLGLEGGYGRCLRVELVHKLHDERRYASLEALQQGIEQDVADARAWLAAR